MKPPYILTFSLLATAPVTYISCHPTVTISADTIRTISPANLETKLHRKNVTDNEEPEEYYEINGKRAYLTIDGKPVEEYLTAEKK